MYRCVTAAIASLALLTACDSKSAAPGPQQSPLAGGFPDAGPSVFPRSDAVGPTDGRGPQPSHFPAEAFLPAHLESDDSTIRLGLPVREVGQREATEQGILETGAELTLAWFELPRLAIGHAVLLGPGSGVRLTGLGFTELNVSSGDDMPDDWEGTVKESLCANARVNAEGDLWCGVMWQRAFDWADELEGEIRIDALGTNPGDRVEFDLRAAVRGVDRGGAGLSCAGTHIRFKGTVGSDARVSVEALEITADSDSFYGEIPWGFIPDTGEPQQEIHCRSYAGLL